MINQEHAFMYGTACSCLLSFPAADQFAVGSLAHPTHITLQIPDEHQHHHCPLSALAAFLGRQNGWQDTSPVRWEASSCQPHNLWVSCFAGVLAQHLRWPGRALTQLTSELFSWILLCLSDTKYRCHVLNETFRASALPYSRLPRPLCSYGPSLQLWQIQYEQLCFQGLYAPFHPISWSLGCLCCMNINSVIISLLAWTN